MDLQDLHQGRPAIQKMAFKARVRRLMETKKAKQVAKNKMLSLKKTRDEVIRKKGAATRS